MERSAEVEAAIRDWSHAVGKGDTSAVATMFADGDVRVVGSDPEEWWGPDRSVVQRLFAQQLTEMTDVSIEPNDLEGYAEGTVGWAAARPRVTAGGESSEARLTAVLRQSEGAWRIAQLHLSFGVANADTLGQQLTTS